MLIKNGTIIDGTGRDRYKADIRIIEDKINEIGETIDPLPDEVVINAKGCYVTPGFVDIMNHSDAYITLFENMPQESLLQQGITTILMGNCGSSLAPLTDGVFVNSIQKWGDTSKINVNWRSMAEYLQELDRHSFGPNMATLTGHSTIRRALVGDDPRQLNDRELQQMEYMLERSIMEGSFGVSTGLAYTHAKHADERELMTIMNAVKKQNALYSTHIRNESEGFLDAVYEALSLAAKTGVSLQFSHLKMVNYSSKEDFEEALTAIGKQENANFDVYPYKTTASVLYTFLPKWASTGGNLAMFDTINDPSKRTKLVKEMQESNVVYKDLKVAMGGVSPTYFGKTLGEIAEGQDTTPEEAALNLIMASGNRIIVFNHSLNKENLMLAIKHPKGFISSDGVGYKEEDASKGQFVHPRYFGAIPKLFDQYIKEEALLTWEESINKITEGPAVKMGLTDRGALKEGHYADVVVFDPEKIKSNATFKNPYRYPSGIKNVIVNGKVSVANGQLSETAGRVLFKT